MTCSQWPELLVSNNACNRQPFHLSCERWHEVSAYPPPTPIRAIREEVEAPSLGNRTSCHPLGSPDEGEQETVHPGDQHLEDSAVSGNAPHPQTAPCFSATCCYLQPGTVANRPGRRMILRFMAYDRKTHFGKFRKGTSRRF